jgi:hypothetical protein
MTGLLKKSNTHKKTKHVHRFSKISDIKAKAADFIPICIVWKNKV